ncbi:glycosyltransferase family 71 protein, partial [Sphaerobolus stellatus SS14]
MSPSSKKSFNLKQLVSGSNGFWKRIILLCATLVLMVLVITNYSFLNTLSLPSSTRTTLCAPPNTQSTSAKDPSSVPPTHLHPLPLNATLSDRLTAFRTAPGAGWEPATFVKWNLETCSNVVPNHNKDLLAKSTLVWASLNSSEIMGHREKMAGFLEQKEREGVFDDPVHVSKGGKGLVGSGRGIVFTAGNADTLSRVITALRLIRHHHHCHLPALIFHFPSEAPPQDSSLRSDLALLNAKLVSATGRARDPSRQKNYHLKAQSIVDAPFSEVLYLDSDNLPADNPELLFDMPNYKRLGVYFTPDYWKTSASNPIWQIMG